MSEDLQLVLPSGYKLQNYRIISVLGQGGFGITYLAHDEALDQRVAIKEFFPATLMARQAGSRAVHVRDPGSEKIFRWGLERFLSEARILARLSHPNIVRVLYFMPANNTGYMVMQYEEGLPLNRWVDRLGRRPTSAEILALLDPLTAALGVVHDLGLAHRDIKPENIYIRSDGSPVILDFGAARNTISGPSHTMAAIVSEGYSPLEQYSNVADQGPWTDIYAIGAVAYWLALGKPPADAPSRSTAKLSGKPDPCQPIRDVPSSGVPQQVARAIDRALALGVSERPQSMRQWRADLGLDPPLDRLDTLSTPTPTAADAPSTWPPDWTAEGGGRTTVLPTGSGASQTVPRVLLAIAAAGLFSGLGWLAYTNGWLPQERRDLIGDTPAAAFLLGALSQTPQTISDEIGGGDERDVIAFDAAAPALLVIADAAALSALEIAVQRTDGTVLRPLQRDGRLVFRLPGPETRYFLTVAAQASLALNYRLDLSALPLAKGAGETAADPEHLDVSGLTGGRTLKHEGVLWARGDERHYAFRLEQPTNLAFAIAAPTGQAVLTLADAQGLGLGRAQAGDSPFALSLVAGDYRLVATAQEDAAVAFALAIERSQNAVARPAAHTTPSAAVAPQSRRTDIGELGGTAKTLAMDLEAGEQEFEVAFRTTTRGRLMLEAESGTLSRAEIIETETGRRVASLAVDQPGKLGTVDIPAGQYVARMWSAQPGQDLRLLMSLAPAEAAAHIGVLSERTITRTVRLGSADRLTTTLVEPALVRLRIAGTKGGLLPLSLRIAVTDLDRGRGRDFAAGVGTLFEKSLSLEQGRYGFALIPDAQTDTTVDFELLTLARLDDPSAGQVPPAAPNVIAAGGTVERRGYVWPGTAAARIPLAVGEPGQLVVDLVGLDGNADLVLLDAEGTILEESRSERDKAETISREVTTGQYTLEARSSDTWITPYRLEAKLLPFGAAGTPPSAAEGARPAASALRKASATVQVSGETGRSAALALARARARAAVVLGEPTSSLSFESAVRTLAQGIPNGEVWMVSSRGEDQIVAELAAYVQSTAASPQMTANLSAKRVAAGDQFDVEIEGASAEPVTVGVFAWGADNSVVRIFPQDKVPDPVRLAQGQHFKLSERKVSLVSAPLPGERESREAIVVVACQTDVDFVAAAPMAGVSTSQSTLEAINDASFLERLAKLCPNRLSVEVLPYVVHE
ncbi:MAG: serine/threonine-protein kinase [Hyphomicrobiaceae bacterium]|nr:serine/threonine-protein kinase [Hyphomicrobiaceae bacterium]